MNIWLDATFLPGDFRAIILHSLGKRYRIIAKNQHRNSNNRDDSKDFLIVEYNEGSFDDFKSILEDILKNNRMEQFVVAENTDKHNTYTVLKEGDLEQFGLVICNHCGMIFGNHDEKMAHEKIHYFI